jgi:hypothetical protein
MGNSHPLPFFYGNGFASTQPGESSSSFLKEERVVSAASIFSSSY